MRALGSLLNKPPAIAIAWAALVALTFFSLASGEWFSAASWLPLFVAVVIWIKATLVARYFIESHNAHPFIAWLMRVFIAFAALALLLTAYFPAQIARWTTIF